MTARQVARKRVDFPPIFGPVNSKVRGWQIFVFPPRWRSLGTGSPPLSARAYGCQSPLMFSIGPPVSLQKFVGFERGKITGLHITPEENFAVMENDLNTSTQLMA